MRWALVKVCLAVTAMVVIAFAVPLGLVVKETARDRAFSNAERQAATVGPVLAITRDRQQLKMAVASTEAGGDGRLAVHVPTSQKAESGTRSTRPQKRAAVQIGRQRATDEQLATARGKGRASTVTVPGGYTLLRPTAVASGEFAVVEVFISNGEVTHNVTTSWVVLAGVGIALILGSVVVADRLGTLMVRPAGRLAAAAHALGEGKLGVRVPEEGPTELRSAASAFNSMADQVVQLLNNERELAADLSHRLRTPLTVLRLNAASLGDGDAADQTREAVAKLETEVDQIISTAREQREQRAQSPGGLEASACDAAEVIRERMAFWSALAEDEGREARLAGVERPVRVPVARGELVAALDAMLGNVFRHTPVGTAFSVDVHRGGTASNSVIVLVSDAGPGIADPAAALRRGHGDGRPGSTGLGLDIVRRVAEATGGDVRVGPSVLGGTEVRVWLTLDGGEGVERKRVRRRAERRLKYPMRRAT
ncbi:HAMP domain-containing sensor histidine kinase [Streptomyces albidus (ex Kaewkla and Franco 2022)]|uniref:HAMP domain-containing sensor histidine kinase n=1 Tax=Streptomyces albidus (ex Kaewkla and Franco 2022) TaxID=722709 RepID=UPI0015EF66E7|nr:HAMP domain-containing sensor histidine kinase [Streptomyces albidus (ex Kaewkla and Franco 2022)]